MKKLLLFAVILGAGSLFADLQLAKGGKTDYVISGDIKSQSAAELQTYLSKMSGAEFILCPENAIPPNKNVIYVGNSSFAGQGPSAAAGRGADGVGKTAP